LQTPDLQKTPEYVKAVEVRRALLDDTRDEWWKLEVEALCTEMQDTVAEVKTQSSDVQELLKLVHGVQASLNQSAPQSTTPRRSHSLLHSEGTKTVLMSPDTSVTDGSHPVRVSTNSGSYLVPAPLSLGGE
jgi:hypothetical protein